MGMYTELQFNCKIKKDIPENVLSVLNYFGKNNNEEPTNLPDHIFFKDDSRWALFGRCGSAYFDAEPFCIFKEPWPDCNYYILNMIFNLKNYDDEIEKFLNWILPYIETPHSDTEYLGYFRYEEYLIPTLIFINNKKIKLVTIKPKNDNSFWYN